MSDHLTASPEAQAILSRLLSLHPKRIDLSLGRMERLLGKLGDPQTRDIIHQLPGGGMFELGCHVIDTVILPKP